MAEDWKEQYDYYFDKVNNANVESAKKQMDFQREMSSTAHQREVYDLIQAGLNPVLSANNGASSPMGAYANVDSSPISAKFARQNLNKELENARLITKMQNDTQTMIAMAQLAQQMELGKYTVDQNNRTSTFNTVLGELGPLGALAYGLNSGMFTDQNIVDQASGLVNDHNWLSTIIDSVNNTSKQASDTSAAAEKKLAEIDEYLKKNSNPQSKAANVSNNIFNKIASFIYNTSPKDFKAPPQYKTKNINFNFHKKINKYGNSSAK